MAHKTLIGGTAYDIAGGNTLISGTGYGITGGRTLIGGTGYDISFGTYMWQKFNAVATTAYTRVNSGGTSRLSSTKTLYKSSSYTFDSSTGVYTLSSYSATEHNSSSDTRGSFLNYGYFMLGNYTGSTLYYVSTSGWSRLYMNWYQSGVITFDGVSDGESYSASIRVYTSTQTTTYSQGTTVYGYVFSDDESAYPENGEQDGFWYVLQS